MRTGLCLLAGLAAALLFAACGGDDAPVESGDGDVTESDFAERDGDAATDTEPDMDSDETGCIEEPVDTDPDIDTDPAQEYECIVDGDENEDDADIDESIEDEGDADMTADGDADTDAPPEAEAEAAEDDVTEEENIADSEPDAEPPELEPEPEPEPELIEEEAPAEPCPPDMALVDYGNIRFCIDRYEASKETLGGVDIARSVAGATPWFSINNIETARNGCDAAGKRLCSTAEWVETCGGPEGLEYSYGDDYDPATCNGIDTYCNCEPYGGCYWDCGASFHVMPTGSFPDCTNSYGIFDINGNVWEILDSSDGVMHFRGGAYNCGDSEALHKCSYEATWNPSARGFRCCMDPQD